MVDTRFITFSHSGLVVPKKPDCNARHTYKHGSGQVRQQGTFGHHETFGEGRTGRVEFNWFKRTFRSNPIDHSTDMEPSFGERRRQALFQVVEETVGLKLVGWTQDITREVIKFFCDWPKESSRYCPVEMLELESDSVSCSFGDRDRGNFHVQVNDHTRFELSGRIVERWETFSGSDILFMDVENQEMDFIRLVERRCLFQFANFLPCGCIEGFERVETNLLPASLAKELVIEPGDRVVLGCGAHSLNGALYLSFHYVKRV